MQERHRKKRAKFDAWLTSLAPEDRAFWDSLASLEEVLADAPTIEEMMEGLPTWEELPLNEKAKSTVKGGKQDERT